MPVSDDNETRMLLDPGMYLTLRPMRYPHFYDRYRDAIKNTWTVEEVDLHSDLKDLQRLTDPERHLVSRLVAFFAPARRPTPPHHPGADPLPPRQPPRGPAVPPPPALRGGGARAVLPDP